MRIGFLSHHDPRDPGLGDGVPHRARQALLVEGHDVVDLFPNDPPVERPERSWLGRLLWGRPPLPAERARVHPDTVFARAVGEALLRSRRAQRELFPLELDLIFACDALDLLYDVPADLPVLAYLQATAPQRALAPEGRDAPPGWERAQEHIERRGLSRVTRLLVATEAARTSAITDYGLDGERVSVLPPGPRTGPRRHLAAPPYIGPPCRTDLRLVTVAGSPRRRRLDTTLDAVDLLRAWGYRTRLTVVGHGARPPLGRPGVRRLALEPRRRLDRLRYGRLLRRSHALVLAPEWEACGLPAIDAAHHGRPSVVSQAGGLPEAVLHEQTGLVLPLGACPAHYAAAVASLAERPGRYLELSRGAMERARRHFSWDAWRRGVRPVLVQVAAEHRARRQRRRPPVRAAAARAPLEV